jgi:NADH-quinone oxidoreductase subunit H
MLALLQQAYSYQDAVTIWEALRVWLNGEPIPGYRFGQFWANALMLISALIFILLLEVLLTVGLQIWERRVLGRMHQRRGPAEYGGVSTRNALRVVWPIAALLAVPAALYGLEYWTSTAQVSRWLILALAVCALAGLIPALVGQFTDVRHTRQFAAAGIACTGLTLILLGLALLPPIVFPGNSLTVVTVVCSLLAFLIYMVYMLGWYWRQGLADAVKLFFKEDISPLNADRFLFLAAPILVYVPALISWIVIPFGVAIIGGHYCYMVIQDLNVGLLLIIADFAMFLVAVIMSGYGSNNKYALVGAMREAAMLLTYEVPMLMSLLCVAVFAGSLNLVEIVERQSMTWAALPLLPAFIIYFICSLADTNRPPFDLPEASNELLGGYFVEYSGLRFALFYVAEYANVFTVSAVMVVCFLGGWKGPMFLGPDGLWLSSLFWFLLKTYILVYFFIWTRATFPRIRIDQIMFFSWKFLLPVSTLVLGVTAYGVVYRHPWFSANRLWNAEQGRWDVLSTAQALAQLNAHDKAFFWIYNIVLLGLAVFILGAAWRILFARRVKHPLPRRAVSWQEEEAGT